MYTHSKGVRCHHRWNHSCESLIYSFPHRSPRGKYYRTLRTSIGTTCPYGYNRSPTTSTPYPCALLPAHRTDSPNSSPPQCSRIPTSWRRFIRRLLNVANQTMPPCHRTTFYPFYDTKVDVIASTITRVF